MPRIRALKQFLLISIFSNSFLFFFVALDTSQFGSEPKFPLKKSVLTYTIERFSL